MPYDERNKQRTEQQREYLTHNHEELCEEIKTGMWLYEGKESWCEGRDKQVA